MAYEREKLVAAVVELVAQRPRATEEEIAALLGVHRHTFERALAATGVNLAELRGRAVLRRIGYHLLIPTPEPWKAVWTELGFSSASVFARYVRRLTGRSPRELGQSALKKDNAPLDVRGGGGRG